MEILSLTADADDDWCVVLTAAYYIVCIVWERMMICTIYNDRSSRFNNVLPKGLVRESYTLMTIF